MSAAQVECPPGEVELPPEVGEAKLSPIWPGSLGAQLLDPSGAYEGSDVQNYAYLAGAAYDHRGCHCDFEDVAITDNADSAIGTVLGGEVVIAFRGSVLKTDEEALNLAHWFGPTGNLNYSLDKLAHGRQDGREVPMVYKGMQAAYKQVREKVLDWLTRQKAERLTIVGHSRGGALAALFTAEVTNDPSRAGLEVRLVTFGTPPMGDKAFRELLHGRGVRIARFANRADLVPRLGTEGVLHVDDPVVLDQLWQTVGQLAAGMSPHSMAAYQTNLRHAFQDAATICAEGKLQLLSAAIPAVLKAMSLVGGVGPMAPLVTVLICAFQAVVPPRAGDNSGRQKAEENLQKQIKSSASHMENQISEAVRTILKSEEEHRFRDVALELQAEFQAALNNLGHLTSQAHAGWLNRLHKAWAKALAVLPTAGAHTPMLLDALLRAAVAEVRIHCVDSPPPGAAENREPADRIRDLVRERVRELRPQVKQVLDEYGLASLPSLPQAVLYLRQVQQILQSDGRARVDFLEPAEDLRMMLRSAGNLFTGGGLEQKALKDVQRMCEAANLNVLIVGPTSSGKSTLANALFGKIICPVGVTPTSFLPVVFEPQPSGSDTCGSLVSVSLQGDGFGAWLKEQHVDGFEMEGELEAKEAAELIASANDRVRHAVQHRRLRVEEVADFRNWAFRIRVPTVGAGRMNIIDCPGSSEHDALGEAADLVLRHRVDESGLIILVVSSHDLHVLASNNAGVIHRLFGGPVKVGKEVLPLINFVNSETDSIAVRKWFTRQSAACPADRAGPESCLAAFRGAKVLPHLCVNLRAILARKLSVSGRLCEDFPESGSGDFSACAPEIEQILNALSEDVPARENEAEFKAAYDGVRVGLRDSIKKKFGHAWSDNDRFEAVLRQFVERSLHEELWTRAARQLLDDAEEQAAAMRSSWRQADAALKDLAALRQRFSKALEELPQAIMRSVREALGEHRCMYNMWVEGLIVRVMPGVDFDAALVARQLAIPGEDVETVKTILETLRPNPSLRRGSAVRWTQAVVRWCSQSFAAKVGLDDVLARSIKRHAKAFGVEVHAFAPRKWGSEDASNIAIPNAGFQDAGLTSVGVMASRDFRDEFAAMGGFAMGGFARFLVAGLLAADFAVDSLAAGCVLQWSARRFDVDWYRSAATMVADNMLDEVRYVVYAHVVGQLIVLSGQAEQSVEGIDLKELDGRASKAEDTCRKLRALVSSWGAGMRP